MKGHALAGKKILITAGPTWVPIDDVRVISNTSSGEMGTLLAKEAQACGMDVDVILGPVTYRDPLKGVRVERFKYFDELLRHVSATLARRQYDIILHAAAVSDYLLKPVPGKISSANPQLILRLTSAPKLIDVMRRLNPKAFLVMFKLEGKVTDAVLLKRSLEAMKKASADLVIANRFEGGHYRGFILGSKNILAKSASKQALAASLFKILKEKMA
ncbi:phosphopantothenoylcysteine decarboxylase / Phosphopantothenoylcysteine synthetase [Candidatus Velamenicoccus archaeovorus]|uniref:Phosphopantothenoylcysteine decarboxylase / Phosphopantothenoylcysteine synthetase n=1 Tax=Velamenicoccus archaeovorus TaxID=1930593 RepID=A0A410P4I9_VELA1|nr:phosphopantothenoylcysteine decarboxylase [Candidatus Velamenicoccus archaeovorus]QAT17099.1 phosphopantothenoylcysteine decarboxylase / Phosphopantothenoylcysteine synthetase [Candidatus Velamenicoccus archaeovorus]